MVREVIRAVVGAMNSSRRTCVCLMHLFYVLFPVSVLALLSFSQRDKYLSGQSRFKSNYNYHNGRQEAY